MVCNLPFEIRLISFYPQTVSSVTPTPSPSSPSKTMYYSRFCFVTVIVKMAHESLRITAWATRRPWVLCLR